MCVGRINRRCVETSIIIMSGRDFRGIRYEEQDHLTRHRRVVFRRSPDFGWSKRVRLAPRASRPRAKARTYTLVAPIVAPSGESFTGIVIEKQGDTETPLKPGDSVEYSGKILEVKPGGVVQFPPLARAGMAFLSCLVRRSGNTVGIPVTGIKGVIPAITAVNVPPELPCSISHTAPIVSSHAPFSVFGQGLNHLAVAQLVPESGDTVLLPPSVGSSLQQIYYGYGQTSIPKGTFHFTASDAPGVKYTAPNICTNPTLQLSGTPVTFKGQRGTITIKSAVTTGASITGGEPAITLDSHQATVTAGKPTSIGFRANVVGVYNVSVFAISPDAVPPPKTAPRTNSSTAPPQTSFDPASNKTLITAPVKVMQSVR